MVFNFIILGIMGWLVGRQNQIGFYVAFAGFAFCKKNNITNKPFSKNSRHH